MRVGFFLDLNRCIGCRACEGACQNWKGPGFPLRRVQAFAGRVKGRWQEYYLSLACNHCENPECFRVCPARAYNKRRDGIVLHNSGRCSGCNRCVRACPFGAPRYNLTIGKVEKCDLCVERIDNGLPPACVEACPVKALQVLQLDEGKELGERWVPGLADVNITRPTLRLKAPEEEERFFLVG
ncbi:anaerobic dimethyl sulfoxide reductase chain B [Moorella thermoacetica]|uniref:4Fe-4S dicluster domain-containing protein n=1 Tax=Neomoorella thermoacetica TaxID=1525 RepID=UPI00069E09D5|nr:4Fe-4S dicluster domain-containing protein [Moorella thermoacetica]AKX94159.1 anaerobic dimethyl sulfoxide reductase chain B [Moorella thermoacetica]